MDSKLPRLDLDPGELDSDAFTSWPELFLLQTCRWPDNVNR